MEHPFSLRLRGAVIGAAALLALASAARAQNMNIDIGLSGFSTPSNAYGAAASQPGLWNEIDGSQPGVSFPLVNLSGAATSASVSYTSVGNSVGNFTFDNPNTSGDDQALLDDLRDIGNGGTAPPSESVFTFTGLANGSYTVYAYCFAPDNRVGYSTGVTVTGGTKGAQVCGNAQWTGQHVLGGTYVTDTVNVTTGQLVIKFDSRGINGNFGSANGIQLASGGCSGSVTTYCTAKVNSAGCTPSIGSTGTPSAAAGSGFNVTTVNVLDSKFGLFFYSKTGASSSPFQGGILCAQPPLVRTMVQNSGGTPPCGGLFAIDFNAYIASGKDPGLVSGQNVWLQTWSRDPGFAPPNNTNLSDALTFVICP
jgi:hypothetical protein